MQQQSKYVILSARKKIQAPELWGLRRRGKNTKKNRKYDPTLCVEEYHDLLLASVISINLGRVDIRIHIMASAIDWGQVVSGGEETEETTALARVCSMVKQGTYCSTSKSRGVLQDHTAACTTT
eukprot:scaffold5055_cov91-Cylindrotheca_fusiformis.AAC.1